MFNLQDKSAYVYFSETLLEIKLFIDLVETSILQKDTIRAIGEAKQFSANVYNNSGSSNEII